MTPITELLRAAAKLKLVQIISSFSFTMILFCTVSYSFDLLRCFTAKKKCIDSGIPQECQTHHNPVTQCHLPYIFRGFQTLRIYKNILLDSTFGCFSDFGIFKNKIFEFAKVKKVCHCLELSKMTFKQFWSAIMTSKSHFWRCS